MKETLAILADGIERAFTPFAFTCECKGADPSCARALADEATQIRYYAMLDIVRFIKNLEV